jgi:hypothetical protein
LAEDLEATTTHLQEGVQSSLVVVEAMGFPHDLHQEQHNLLNTTLRQADTTTQPKPYSRSANLRLDLHHRPVDMQIKLCSAHMASTLYNITLLSIDVNLKPMLN